MKKQQKTTRTCQPIEWDKALLLLTKMRNDAERDNDRNLALTCLMFGIGFYTGLRISDILSLRWGMIWRDEWKDIQEKKTGKLKRITVHPQLRRIINWAYSFQGVCDKGSLDDTVFKAQRGPKAGRQMSVVSANARIADVFRRYNVKVEHASSHTLRKTFGLRVYDVNGRTDEALLHLAKVFNHRDTSVTRDYLGITAQVIADVYLSI